MEIKISPSVLACDLSNLEKEVKAMTEAGAEMIHLDVMDGAFVPNISFGAPVIKCLRGKTDIFFDTHLMIQKPDKYADDFINAGSDMITFHVEADCNIGETLKYIKGKGIKTGLVVKPATPAEAIFPYIAEIDMALVMSVEPGFGGQGFMENQLSKVTEIRRKSQSLGLDLDIQIDGGINEETGFLAAKAGANVFVAGSSLFKQADYKIAVESLKAACIKGYSEYKG